MPNISVNNMPLIGFLVVVWGLAVTVFWMYVAWRAMRAHEKLAQSVEDISKKQQ